MTKIKVLFLCGDLDNFGGTERVSSIIANELSILNYDVIMASITNGMHPFFALDNEIKVTSISKSSRRILYQVPKIIYNIRKLVLKENIDIVIVVDTISVLFTIPALVGLKIKHIGWEHFNFNNNLGKKGRNISRQLAARYCDSIITLTERDKKYWLQGTCHKSQIIAIANPCPFPVQEHIEKENTKIVLAVGRLVSLKGFDMLLKAWVKVTRSAPDWKLQIVGDGQEKEKLNDFIIENNLTESVEISGSTDNVKKYYEEAEVFCLSSRFEGFPMVLLEALSFGLPVVSFDCDTGPAEILEGTGSVLVPSNDIDLFASALLDLINDKELRKTISVKSKIKAEKYQTSEVIKDWEKEFKKII